MNLLELHNVCCGYSQFRLDHISFGVGKGSFAGIVGPNGSGKTTLFRGIAGTLPLSEGQIRLNGQSLREMSLRQKARQIAIVSQFIEAGDMTVEDYVLMGRIPHHARFTFFETEEDYRIACEMMKKTGSWRFRDKLMSELSGGEQQLAGIARALAQQPQLLLLDEPTSHLDITHQVHILNLLQELNEQTGLTILMVIHDLNLAAEYCDHLFLVNEGKLHTSGTPEEVLTFRNIEDVWNTVVVTQTNPVSGKPVVFLVSGKVMKKQQEQTL
jgi:iron complex transport system ATP-binding protein